MPSKIREVKERYPDKKVTVWFQDEARVGQHGTLTHVWAKTGKDLVSFVTFDLNMPIYLEQFVQNLKQHQPLFVVGLALKKRIYT